MGQSASKRVSGSLRQSQQFNGAVASEFQHCLALTQHAFSGVLPYQLLSAAQSLHLTLSGDGAGRPHPLISRWVRDPPALYQVDRAYRVVSAKPSQHQAVLELAQFKEFAVELFTDAVVDNAGKAVLRRVPVVIAGISGFGWVLRLGKEIVGTLIGAYALGVAASMFLGLSG